MRMLFIIMVVCCFAFSGCSSGGDSGDKRAVAQVNDYKMTVEDLKYEIDNVPFDESGLLESKEGRMAYIDRLLEKEVLLQEAQKQGLDREKDFMKSIENYWEQALLKLLLERKSKEISGLIHVYDDEIEKYYETSKEDLSLPKVRAGIRELIRQKKETEAMNEWIEDLKKSSWIKVDEEMVDQVLNKGGEL